MLLTGCFSRAQDRGKWRTLVNTVMQLGVPPIRWDLTRGESISLFVRFQPHGGGGGGGGGSKSSSSSSSNTV